MSATEPVTLLTENESNSTRLFFAPASGAMAKDAFHDFVIAGENRAVLDLSRGTKAARHFVVTIPPGGQTTLKLRLTHRQDLAWQISYLEREPQDGLQHNHRLLAIPSRERLKQVLNYVLDESEFLSDYGVRALSKTHESKPFSFWVGGEEHRVEYVPGESTTGLFGGNSNWRGPIWFPVNYLLIEALERYHYFYGDSFEVECPARSGQLMNLQQVADELSRRLASLFLPDASGRRPCHGDETRFAEDPHWRDLALFHEYFHGDTGRGVGASHQTGWTALVTRLLGKAVNRRNGVGHQ